MWVYYYKNGQIHYQKKYYNGLLEGERSSYYKNGNICFKGSFKNNKKFGEWIYYDIEGKVIQKKNYG